MPRGDRTGPGGQGPMTGRAAGYCSGYTTPGYVNPGGRFLGSGRGLSGGRGRGIRHRHWYYGPGQPGWTGYDMDFPVGDMTGMPYQKNLESGDEKEFLSQQADYLRQQLDDIQKRMSELEKGKKTK